MCGLQTIADVKFQDGKILRNVPSCDLYPVDDLLENDFCPEDFVVHKSTGQVGVVKSVNLQNRTCNVLWRSLNKQTMKFDFTEDPNPVSIFDLSDHPEYRFRLSDIVQLLPQSDVTNDTNSKWIGVIIDMKSGKLKIHWNNHEETWVDVDGNFFVLFANQFGHLFIFLHSLSKPKQFWAIFLAKISLTLPMHSKKKFCQSF